MKKEHYILFTIGPVKSFISDSRKTQDLFAGSDLLSKMAHIAIDKATIVFKENAFEIITPIINSKKDAIPNRFLASFSCEDDKAKIKEKVQEIEDAVQKFFTDKKIFNKIGLLKGAEKQLTNHLDVHWVVLPATTDYKTDFLTINQQLASIKNQNVFTQDNEIGRKCIVDGRKNVKYYRLGINEKQKKDGTLYKLFNDDKNVKIIKTDEDKEIKIWHLQEGEGISAVTMRKRLHQQKPHEFPSTVGVALMDMFDKLENDDDFKDRKVDFLKYKLLVQGDENDTKKYFNHSDDQLFYKENIKAIFNKHNKNGKTAYENHEKWSKDLKQKIPFTKYYALIMFDGDNMGDWFSGQFFKTDIDLKTAQKELSKQLGEFATEIKTSIKESQGKVVFAGGEDFMAFVNIHHLNTVVTKIHEMFKEIVSDKICHLKKEDKELSISMGIAIAHYKQPLSMVIAKAHEMETLAKNEGRNRFAMAVIKHSGTIIHFNYPWLKCEVEAFGTVNKVLDNLNAENFSPAFITKIYKAFEEYGFAMEDYLVKSKISLYVKQAYTGTKEEKETRISELKKLLVQLLSISDSNRNFGDTLLLVDFLYRKTY